MAYQVIARKFRPQTFEDVIGQQHVTQTLQNAIRSGRIAHAYIFSGARGVGKTTTARILAKALNCAKGPTPTPDNTCDSCKEITAGNSLDVIEIDAASNRGIDQIRELRDMVRYAPASGRYKVIILDEAHMLTDEASNALLKTLEEPPDRVIFVMATTEPEALADTIRSRSQHFHFRALQFQEITAALADVAKKEGLRAEPEALAVMARAAEGSVRDALSLLEQARAYSGEDITDAQVRDLLGVVPEEVLEELVGAIREGSAERTLGLVHRFQSEGRNLQHFCREAIRHFRNLLIARVCGADSDLIAATPDQRPRLKRDAETFSEEDLTRYFQILLSTDDDLRRKPDPRLHLEMGLLRMVNASRLAPLEELMAEMRGDSGTASAASGRKMSPTDTEKPAETENSIPATMTASGSARASVAANASASLESASGAENLPKADSHSNAFTATQKAVPIASAPPSIVARSAGIMSGIEAAQVEAIKAAVLRQQKFLAEIIEHASRWELEGSEMRLYFPAESRALADMLGGRGPSEKLRAITSEVIGLPVRVCVKMDSAPVKSAARAVGGAPELRAQFEQDPVVRAMLERFGGQISEVKRRSGG
ncbi:MAG TPA: DNA polymerase III subunit gamma/tau [Candidatus Acidoferrales bacterium]|nr:DNA polymerase III subunit gamma/tau [Candidatus Acidoferrales bacterium]